MLLAVHLSDNVLPPIVCAVGAIIAVVFAIVPGLFRLREDEIPRVALASAAFFVASAIHVPLGVSSVHLILNGLVGVLLGRRAGLAIGLGLVLQYVLLSHGGWTTLGMNLAVLTLPAFLGGWLFRRVSRNSNSVSTLSFYGAVLGFATVMTTVLLQTGILTLADDSLGVPALIWFALHVPLACVEAMLLAFIVGFLARVKPEMLDLPRPAAPSA